MLFNKTLVDDTTRGRVNEITSIILDEEPLRDSLVHDDDNDLGFLGNLVVQKIDRSFELRNLGSKDLVTLSITNTISVDHERCGKLILVMGCESLDRFTDRFLHVVLDNLLTLLLNQVVAVVLTHLLVGRGGETDNGLGTGVAHINTY